MSYVADFYSKHPPIYDAPVNPELSDDIVKTYQEDHESLIEIIEGNDVKTILEIGTSRGYTARLMAEHPQVEHVVTMDIWPKAGDQVRDCPKATFWCQSSFNLDIEPHINKYDMIHIDGSHGFADVVADTRIALALKPKVISWHDWGAIEGTMNWQSVKDAVYFFAEKIPFEIITKPQIIAYAVLRKDT